MLYSSRTIVQDVVPIVLRFRIGRPLPLSTTYFVGSFLIAEEVGRMQPPLSSVSSLASVRLQEVGFLSAQRRFLVNQRAEKCLRYKTIFKDVFSAVTWHLSSLYLGIRTALIRARASRFRFHGVA